MEALHRQRVRKLELDPPLQGHKQVSYGPKMHPTQVVSYGHKMDLTQVVRFGFLWNEQVMYCTVEIDLIVFLGAYFVLLTG